MGIVHADELAEAQRETAARHELLRAELAATLTELHALVRVLRRGGGYMPSGDQLALRSAEARLVAHGRSVEDGPVRSMRP